MPAGTTLLWWIATIRNSASMPCVSVTHRAWIATPRCKNWQPPNSPSCKSPRTPSFVPRQRQPWIRSGNIWKRTSRIRISFFDLPGTINNDGVLTTLSGMDYIFTPISADRISLESTLSFSAIIKEAITDNTDTANKGIYLFWNMVDGREKTPLYAMYEKVIAELGLPVLKTAVPNTTRYKKEVMDEGTTLFRSTIFPASRTLLRGSRLKELVEEILSIVKPEAYGREE
ncbi:hypothetical protein HMPREF0649_01036 [Segatella buccae D17]|nr:hypothetical protein HMPREF0649_01036 [Segatella buccae D17]